MSDNFDDDTFEHEFESELGELNTGAMGSLQSSINRSLELAASSKRTYLPGETKSTNHLIFEMNEFYMEMAQRINELNLKSYDNCVDDDEDVEDTDSVLYDVVSAIRKKRNDPEMKKQIETILKLDQMMETSFNTLKEERLERQRVQKELCEIIDKEDDKYARTRFFRNLCDLENGKSNSESATSSDTTQPESEAEKDTELASHASQLQGQDQDQPQARKEVKFIKRNIQLAKNTPTVYNPAYSLTDEEKAKLDNLLIDLDEMEESDTVTFGNDDDCDHLRDLNDTTTNYPFSLSEQDQTRMRELESKLGRLSEASLASSKQKTTVYNGAASRRWPNEDRLRRIDEKLEKLQSARESFSFTPTAPTEVEPALAVAARGVDDTANDVESISYDTLRERSQIMLDRIASIVLNANPAGEYSDHEHDEPERD